MVPTPPFFRPSLDNAHTARIKLIVKTVPVVTAQRVIPMRQPCKYLAFLKEHFFSRGTCLLAPSVESDRFGDINKGSVLDRTYEALGSLEATGSSNNEFPE